MNLKLMVVQMLLVKTAKLGSIFEPGAPGFFCQAVSLFVSCVYAPKAINKCSHKMKPE